MHQVPKIFSVQPTLLMMQIIQEKQLLFGFSDLSRNDEQDTNMPEPSVAVFPAKVEYNGCVCFIAASHLRMLLCKLLLLIDSQLCGCIGTKTIFPISLI
jgi:hypothetical protein